MAARRISIEDFLQLAQEHLVVDVRSPLEYQHAHYPAALSIPLFNDEERKIVGTTYKKQSRENAIKIGLDYFGPKMKKMVEEVEVLLRQRNSKTLIVHCWRGGMRSGAVAWLLDIYGFKVYTLEGGYKKFRAWVLQQLSKDYKLKVLGGFTGSAKTETLKELAKLNEHVIDLEDLAIHKGSAFGSLGLPPQCSTEQFENKLALSLHHICQIKKEDDFIWVESESQRIGNINITHTFYKQMLASPYCSLDIPFEERLNHIVESYGKFDKQDILNAIERIKKRLGGLETKNAIEYLMNDDLRSCFKILLAYYDKHYGKSSSEYNQEKIKIILPNTNAENNAKLILKQLTTN